MRRDRRVERRWFRFIRAAWGALLIADPARALDAITQTGTEPAVRRLVQVLGGRDVIQALLATDRRRGQVGIAVDALHAVSMTGLALATTGGRRRLALTSAAVAGGFGVAGWMISAHPERS